MPVACRRLTSGFLLLAVLTSFCGACSLGTRPIQCVMTPAEHVTSYRMICTLYFENCNSSLLNVEYTANYIATTVSCECSNKTIADGSISCTVPEMSDEEVELGDQCAFVPSVEQLQYVFILTEYRRATVTYCVDPRNSVVNMASDAPPPTVVEQPEGQLVLLWHVRSAHPDPRCLSYYNFTDISLPWCLSHVLIHYQYRLMYSLQDNNIGGGGGGAITDGAATRTWQVKDVYCGTRYYRPSSVEQCNTSLTSMYSGVGYDFRLERAPYAYSLEGSGGRRGRAGRSGLTSPSGGNGAGYREGKCVDGFAATSGIKFSVRLNDSVPTAGVVMDANSFSVTNCTDQCVSACRMRNESSDIGACRSVIAYWKEVPLANRGGSITRYKVSIDVFNKTREELEVAGTANNISYCHCTSDANISISIQPATARGLGDRTNTTIKMAVPPALSMKPVDDLMTRRINSTSVLLSWRWKFEGHASFVAFWCSSFERNCKDIDWRHLHYVERHRGTDRYHTTIHLAEANPKELAIAATFGGQGMGIAKPVCSLQPAPKSQLGTLNLLVDVLPTDRARPEPGLRARWNSLTCHEADGLLMAYHVLICSTHGKRGCAEHRVPPNASELEVSTLHRGTKYNVVVRAVVHNGTHVVHSVSSAIEIALTSGISDAVIAGISAAAIFGTAAVLIGIVYCSRWLRDAVQSVGRSVAVPIIRRAPPEGTATDGNDGYVSCRDSYLLPRSGRSRHDDDDDNPKPSPIDVDVRCWKVDADRGNDVFDGLLGWNSGYPELNSDASCTDEYPLLNSPSSLAAAQEDAAAAFAVAAAAAAVDATEQRDRSGEPMAEPSLAPSTMPLV